MDDTETITNTNYRTLLTPENVTDERCVDFTLQGKAHKHVVAPDHLCYLSNYNSFLLELLDTAFKTRFLYTHTIPAHMGLSVGMPIQDKMWPETNDRVLMTRFIYRVFQACDLLNRRAPHNEFVIATASVRAHYGLASAHYARMQREYKHALNNYRKLLKDNPR